MPIINAESIQKQTFRVSLMLSHGVIDNMVITPDGVYTIYYIKNGSIINHTGKVISVVQDRTFPNKSYLVFDCSNDKSGRREHIYFYQVQAIKDVTPNDAYKIAVEHGFVGTVEEWLNELKGDKGDSAYDLAVASGFDGTVEEFLQSLNGKSAYDLAVDQGFTGTLDQWLSQQGDVYAISNRVEVLENKVAWKTSMED